jgi:hypothetical protein
MVFGKALDLLVDHGSKLGPFRVDPRRFVTSFLNDRDSFATSPADRLGPRSPRHLRGDPVEPGGDEVTIADRSGSPDQDEERGLKGVVDVVRVGQDPPADAQDHRPELRHERLERRLIASDREPFEELAIPEAGDRPAFEQPDDIPPARPESPARHGRSPSTLRFV